MTLSFVRRVAGPSGPPRLPPEVQETMARRQGEMARAVRAGTFPVYGLDASWTGSRWLGGTGSNDGTVNYLELGHGVPWDSSARLVRVGAHAERAEAADVEPFIARRLAAQLWHEGADHGLVEPSFSTTDPLSSWDRRTISVNGNPVEFRYLSAKPAWVAFALIDGRLVEVFARNVVPDEVVLVPVTDPEPYGQAPPPPP